jgi:hypothetical protein
MICPKIERALRRRAARQLYPDRGGTRAAGGVGTTCSPQLGQTTGVSRRKRPGVRLR